MKWMIYNALEKFSEYKDFWDDMNRSSYNHILLDSDFVEPLLQAYGTKHTILAVLNNTSSKGIMLLERGNIYTWQTFQPQNAPIGFILINTIYDNVDEMIENLIHALPGISIGLGITNQDPDFTVFNNEKTSNKVEILEHIKTPRINVIGEFADYWNSRNKDFAANIARRERKIIKTGGDLSLVENMNMEEVFHAINEYSRIESSGWKGRQGTAVAENNIQGKIYRDILERFTKRGEGVIYRLLLNGTTIASQICLKRNHMMVFLKTTYDENHKELSPGLLMRKEILNRLFNDNTIETAELYGKVHDWHTKWTDEIRTMFHINYYRNSIVKYSHRIYKDYKKRRFK